MQRIVTGQADRLTFTMPVECAASKTSPLRMSQPLARDDGTRMSASACRALQAVWGLMHSLRYFFLLVYQVLCVCLWAISLSGFAAMAAENPHNTVHKRVSPGSGRLDILRGGGWRGGVAAQDTEPDDGGDEGSGWRSPFLSGGGRQRNDEGRGEDKEGKDGFRWPWQGDGEAGETRGSQGRQKLKADTEEAEEEGKGGGLRERWVRWRTERLRSKRSRDLIEAQEECARDREAEREEERERLRREAARRRTEERRERERGGREDRGRGGRPRGKQTKGASEMEEMLFGDDEGVLGQMMTLASRRPLLVLMVACA